MNILLKASILIRVNFLRYGGRINSKKLQLLGVLYSKNFIKENPIQSEYIEIGLVLKQNDIE